MKIRKEELEVDNEERREGLEVDSEEIHKREAGSGQRG
jgi:hypothetical protein